MIALEVSINGERLCIAGTDDLFVITASVHIGGKLGQNTETPRPSEKSPCPRLHVGGVTRPSGQEGEHLRWGEGAAIAVGDVVELRFVEIDSSAIANPAPHRLDKETMERRSFESAKEKYLRLKARYEPSDL